MLTREQVEKLADVISSPHNAITPHGLQHWLDTDAALRKALALAHEAIQRLHIDTIQLSNSEDWLHTQFAELNADLSLMTQDRDVWRSSCAQVEEERDDLINNLSLCKGNELAAQVDTLQQQLARFKTMSTVEMMCENVNVDAHVREWEHRCLKAEADLARLTIPS